MQGNYDVLLDLNATSPMKLPVTLGNQKISNQKISIVIKKTMEIDFYVIIRGD